MVYSYAEAEIGGTFKNVQNVISLWHILENVLLHRQPTKVPPIVTYNLTSQCILTSFIKPCKPKTWDLRYHWLENRIYQRQIQLIWNSSPTITFRCSGRKGVLKLNPGWIQWQKTQEASQDTRHTRPPPHPMRQTHRLLAKHTVYCGNQYSTSGYIILWFFVCMLRC